ncbi:hypothetical protein [Novosphingobium sp. P6W]|uniref:hypothetical protein n=1 Tax=Novosphingobium sp. P6W TaxID=1609758 RepID=UPI000AF45A75|nr:hypothetical protein [Novosphingobium sp. P6W]
MDMKHDFSPDPYVFPEIETRPAYSPGLAPELVAIAAIFFGLWLALAVDVLSEGFFW